MSSEPTAGTNAAKANPAEASTKQVTPEAPRTPKKRGRIEIRAGILVCLGLLVQVPTLFQAHPIAFLTFALIGGVLVLAGASYYLAVEGFGKVGRSRS